MASPPRKSFGNMSDDHWSRSRTDANEEALEYYRERSKAPGVAEGGGARNFYCMACDGVVPADHAGDSCPHCGEAIEGRTRRYFNWVEIDEPPRGDVGPVFLIGLGVMTVVVVLLALLAWWIRA